MANIIVTGTGAIRIFRQLDLGEDLDKAGHNVRFVNSYRSLFFLGFYLIRNPQKWLWFLQRFYFPIPDSWTYIFYFLFKRVDHVERARWADVIVVAPVTCNTLAKIAGGISDSSHLLMIRTIQRGRKVILAPSMNPEMWADPFTQDNVGKLKATEKYIVVDPIQGTTLGSGELGVGILAPNSSIINAVEIALSSSSALPERLPA